VRTLLIAVLLVVIAPPAEAKRFRLGKTNRQLVIVTTDGWNVSAAKLERWERGVTGPWKRVGDPVEVVTGKNGLGWGLGLHADDLGMDRAGPLKQEGDGRAPAGAFKLLEATGYAAAPPAGTSLKYTQATDSLRCVDDPKSKRYNQLVDDKAEPKTWASAEDMHRSDALYTFTIVVEHNRKPVVPGQGSCIFLHVAAPAKGPTVGCTAMAQADLETLLVWLKPELEPLFVQLPQKEYEQLAGDWKLPAR
jgi:D-alanyl-D-alanine dipeptidase